MKILSLTGKFFTLLGIRTEEAANLHPCRAKALLQCTLEVPFRARNATKKIQTERGMLRKGMASQMRFGKEAQSGDAAGTGKLMPNRRTNRPELQIFNDGDKERLEHALVA